MLRREFMSAVAILTAAADGAAAQTAGQPRTVLTQDLPPVTLNGWTATALEITYAPGAVSVAANASATAPARFLAIIVAEKGAPLTVT